VQPLGTACCGPQTHPISSHHVTQIIEPVIGCLVEPCEVEPSRSVVKFYGVFGHAEAVLSYYATVAQLSSRVLS
jgi:hypothetical protein